MPVCAWVRGGAVSSMLPARNQADRERICFPGSCGQEQASGQSDTRLTKGIVLVCNGAAQRSDGQARVDTDLIHPLTRECTIDAADGLPILWTCHTAAKALHRLCASSPGELGFPGASALGSECGFRWASQSSMQSADISELAGGVPGPFQPDPHRRGTVPVLCPLRECSRIVTAWQRHGRSGCSGRLSA